MEGRGSFPSESRPESLYGKGGVGQERRKRGKTGRCVMTNDPEPDEEPIMNRQTSWPRLVAVVGVALLLAVVGSGSPPVSRHPAGFVFTLVFPGDPTQGLTPSSTCSSQMS